MIPTFAWTSDRAAAAAVGLALMVFLYVFFFGKRRSIATAWVRRKVAPSRR